MRSPRANHMSNTLPAPEVCTCGHQYAWFVRCDPDDQPDWYQLDYTLVKDVVEQPCPHRNGTVIEYCPACNRKVGMWGCGLAGGMECACWDERPWWRRLLDRISR